MKGRVYSLQTEEKIIADSLANHCISSYQRHTSYLLTDLRMEVLLLFLFVTGCWYSLAPLYLVATGWCFGLRWRLNWLNMDSFGLFLSCCFLHFLLNQDIWLGVQDGICWCCSSWCISLLGLELFWHGSSSGQVPRSTLVQQGWKPFWSKGLDQTLMFTVEDLVPLWWRIKICWYSKMI